MDTVESLPPGQRLLVRVDLNSPIEDGRPQDNRRFARHAESIRHLLEADHAVALLAHQGRPGDEDFVSLAGHAAVLSEHLDQPVDFVDDTYGDRARSAIQDLARGSVLLLENTRMTDDELPEKSPEVHAESEFVRTLAPLFDAYVDDAYSVAHRSHASIVGFPLVMPAYAGPVMVAEYEANSAIATREFDGPVTMVLGGTKATDVIDVMGAIGDRVDRFLVGGVTGELLLRGAGYPVGFDVDGGDRFDDQWSTNREAIEALLEERGESIHLPVDLAYADETGERAEIDVEAIEEKADSYLDVGTATVADYHPVIRESAAVFVKGALGVFEDERFATGTVGVLEAIAATECYSVVGGGDTSRAVELYDLDPAAFDHLSIAGGAYLRALTGASLPGVAVL